MAFRRDALLGMGGFDPQFRVAGDDVDICWRFLDADLPIGYAPGAMVWHHRRATVKAYAKQQKGYGRSGDLRLDIAVNPVTYGAGLKIKSVEAMAFGLPLVSGRQGATGLNHVANEAFLLTPTPEEFAEAINDLAGDADARRRLGAAGAAFVARELNTEACFGPLVEYLLDG